MSHLRRLLTPAQALYQALTASRSALSSSAHAAVRRNSINTLHQTFVTHTRTTKGGSSTYQPKKTVADPFPEFVKNWDIKSRLVRIVDPSSNALSEPRDLLWVIRNLSNPRRLRHEGFNIVRAQEDAADARDEEELFLVQVGPAQDEIPICKIMERKVLIFQRLERNKRQKEQAKSVRQSAPKEIEVNWGVSDNDLHTKLRNMESFLASGKKVNLLLANKKKARRASTEEAQKVLETVRAKIHELGAHETKPMEGRLLTQAVIHVEKKAA